MKKLIIFCDGGLGNRLSVLIGGFIFSKKFNRKTIICWPQNNWCGCGFNDIFDNEETVITDNINELFYKNLNNKFFIHENQTDYKIESYYPNLQNYNLLSSNEDENLIYYNNSIPDFFSLEEILETLKQFKIKSKIIDKVSNFCNDNNINSETRGIHFRKTDFKNFLNEDEIYNLISSKPTVNYFICSDSFETEQKFKSLKNVLIFPKNNYVEKFKDGGWNDLIKDNEGREFDFNIKRSKDSVIEGFIDLLILSKTKIIVESHSTFLKFSKYYNLINI
jgi:hypothetical protein